MSTLAAHQFYPGAVVTVDDGVTPIWAGQVTQIGIMDDDPVTVAVLDPGDNPDVVRGQRYTVPPVMLRHVYRSRWA